MPPTAGVGSPFSGHILTHMSFSIHDYYLVVVNYINYSNLSCCSKPNRANCYFLSTLLFKLVVACKCSGWHTRHHRHNTSLMHKHSLSSLSLFLNLPPSFSSLSPTLFLPPILSLSLSLRASEPQEISRIHSLRYALQQKHDEETLLTEQISECHKQLRLLMEDQENSAYPSQYKLP